MSNLARNLIHLRLKSGLTQGQIANKIGCKTSCYSSYEEGRARTPPVNVLAELCKIYQVRLEQLVLENLKDGIEKQGFSIEAKFNIAPPYIQESVKILLGGAV